jgi:hypothetical protein
MPLIKPNWDIFKAKFSDDPNGSFEWLCYLLICKEFNLPNGIFRYLNQSGMETNPITHDKKIYAWEAKFYSGKLSENEDEFKEKIEIIKEKNPEVRNMIFFTHLEWGESPKKNERDSKPKDDIEKKAKESQIKIEWRCKSYFESLCLKDNLSVILNHFFVRDTSLFDKFQKINKDNEDYLKLIKSEIKYKDQKIILDQSENFSKLIAAINNSQWVIVTGESGVGKSSLLKEFYNKNSKEFPILISQGSDFVRNITNDLLLNQLSLGDLNSIVADVTKKFFIIDSAEALLECRDFNKIKMIFNQLAESGWIIYLNIKESSLNQFSKSFKFSWEIIKINKLPDTAVNNLSKKHQIALPEDHRLYQLLKIPFYLELFLSIEIDKNAQIKEFKELLWQKQILNSEKGLNINSKEQFFFKLIKQKQQENSFYFSDTSDSTILQELQTQGILSYKQGLGYWIVHDIYEDLASEKIIHAEFLRRSSDNEFLESIKQYSEKYKVVLSNWLIESINEDDPSVKIFIESNIKISVTLDENKFLLLPILQTDYSKNFFQKFKEQILRDDSKLRPEIIKTLKTQCIEIDDTFLKILGINYPLNPLQMRVLDTRPKGSGWKHFIDFLYSNWASFKTEGFSLFLDLFYDWSLKNTSSKEAGYITILAIQYLQFLEQNRNKYFIDIDEKKLFLIIIFGANHALNELKEILLSIDNKKTGIMYRFGEFIIKDLDAFSLTNSFPDEIISICQQYWLQRDNSRTSQYQSLDIDSYFGLRRLINYFPSSAYQTPIFPLLNSHYSKAIDFILNFTDRAALKYMDSSLDEGSKTILKVNLNRDENKLSEQIFSHRLWQVHRGNYPNSDILQSIHMALEKYLLAQAETLDREALENKLFYLLENTKSCSITAVVTSIVLAYPHKTFNIALKLLTVKGIMCRDFRRRVCESSVSCPIDIGALGSRHENERLAAKNMPWRTNNLEDIILQYQINTYGESPDNFALRKDLIWSCLDKHYSKLPVQITQGIMNWRMSLAKMDIRKMEIRENKLETGEINYPFNPILEDDLKAYIDKESLKNQKELELLKFKIFLEDRLSNLNSHEFNYDIETILNYIKTVQKNIKDYDDHDPEQLIPNKAAIVLLREHFQKLNETDKNLCKNLIFQLAEKAFLNSYSYDDNAIDESLKSLPLLLDYFPDELINVFEILITVFLFSRHSIPNESLNLLYDKSAQIYESLIAGLIILKTKYQEEKEIFRNTNMSSGKWRQPEEFDKSFKEIHLKIFERTKNSEVSISEANDFIQQLDPSNLVLIFNALPNGQFSQNLQRLIYLLVERYLSFEENTANKTTDFNLKQSFCDKLAELVFNNTEESLNSFLNLLVNKFQNINHDFWETLFQSLIHANDEKQQFSKFWNIWNKFKPCLIEYVQAKQSFYYDDELILSFLFSSQWILLNVQNHNWHSFQCFRDISFFDDLISQIGDDPSVFVSVLRVLNEYALRYLIEKPDKVISWIETMSQSEKIQKLSSDKRIDLIKRLETFIHHFIERHLTRVKQEPSLKNKVLNILNYLESNGSQKAVLLREFVI